MLPPGRAHFWSQGHDFNKLGRGPLDDTKYLWTLGFVVSVKKIFKVLCRKSIFSLCDLDMQQTGI